MPFELRSLFCCIPYLRLEVQGAQHMPGGVWLADFNPGGGNVTITAYTVVGTPIVWAIANGVGAATPAGDQYNVPLNNPANINPVGTTIQVTATAGGIAQTVDIEIKPFLQQVTVRPNHYAFQDPGGAWYAYNLIGIAPNHFLPPNVPPTAEIEAHVLPAATPNVWGHVHWIAATMAMPPVPVALTPGGAPGIRGIPLNAVRTVRVTVGILGSAQPSRQITVDVRPPGNGVNLASNLSVQLDQFIFAGAGRFAVTQEHAAHFNAEYSRRWRRNWAANPRPQGYAANSAMQLNAVTVSVTQAPIALTNLQVRASAYFPLAAGGITILQGTAAPPGPPGAPIAAGTAIGTQFNLGNVAPAINVPNEVMRNDPLLIFWEANNGGGWQPLAVTANTVYVTARAPVATTDGQLNSPAGPVYTYPTLLHISCIAARGLPGAAAGPGGAAAMAAVKTAIYGAFQPANPNPNVVRLNPPAGPPTQLIYWWNHAAGAWPAQSLNQNQVGQTNLFTNPNSNIACGVWARMLIAMWALHGEGTARYIGVWSSMPAMAGFPAFPMGFPNLANIVNPTDFMVRNWDYNNHPGLNPANYTHAVIAMLPFTPGANETLPVPGGAGQNNAAPPDRFTNHFIVRDGAAGNFYDPSYGTAPLARNAWVDASLAGLWDAATNTCGFVQANGLLPNGIQTTHNAVALLDFVAGNWIP